MNTPQNPDILNRIEAFLSETGMSASYFGKKAVGNSELVTRLRNGGDVQTKTVSKILAFITDNSTRGAQ